MSWATLQAAITEAVQHATGIAQVRLSTADRKQNRKQLVELSFEFEPIHEPEPRQTDVEGGLDLGQVVEVLILARLDVVSYTHDPDLSAYHYGLRLLTRSTLPETLAILRAAGLTLERVGRAVPLAVDADQRSLSAVSLAWDLRVRVEELEGAAPSGAAPREYFDRVDVTDDGTPLAARGVAPDLAPASVLDAATWRTLWTGTQTDLVGGRRLVELADGATHNVAREIGTGALDRATVLADDVASLEVSDRDAGVLADGLTLVLVLRAPAAAGRIASRSSDGSAGWILTAEADGSLELSVPGAALALATDAGLLDGETWLLVGVYLDAGTLSLEVQGEALVTGACTLAQAFEDVPLVLGAADAPGAAGLEIALLGEARTDDAGAVLSDMADAVGL